MTGTQNPENIPFKVNSTHRNVVKDRLHLQWHLVNSQWMDKLHKDINCLLDCGFCCCCFLFCFFSPQALFRK